MLSGVQPLLVLAQEPLTSSDIALAKAKAIESLARQAERMRKEHAGVQKCRNKRHYSSLCTEHTWDPHNPAAAKRRNLRAMLHRYYDRDVARRAGRL